MSNADIIQFEANISRSNAATLFIDSGVSLTCYIDAELKLSVFRREVEALTAYINQQVTEEVEL